MQPLVSLLGYRARPSQRVLGSSGRSSRQLPTSGHVFNRMAVEAALRRAVALWGRLKPSEHVNGAILFCSEDMAEAVHPLQPLHCRLYSCGKRFKTEVLREQLEIENSPAYGLIVIDGSDAIIGTSQGLGTATSHSTVCKLAHLQSNTASNTRRGGQSALRYSRLRDGEDLAFCRRVAERARHVLDGVHGVVLAGKANTKHRLHAELPQSLRVKVLCVVNLACSASIEGLRQAASCASDAAAAKHCNEAERVVRSFLESVAMPDSPAGITCCYGEQQTAVALGLGAIDMLLVAADWTGQIRTKDDWQILAEAHRTKFVEIKDRTQDEVQFCKAFRIGGCLRWPLDPELLEESTDQEATMVEADEASQEIISEVASDWAHLSREDLAQMSREEPASMQLPCTADLSKVTWSISATEDYSDAGGRHELFDWLSSALKKALGNEANAEALLACAQVIITDESADRNEALEQAATMLIGEGAPETIVEEMIARAQ